MLARSMLEKEAARVGSFRVVAADELLRGGADPEAWFGLEAEPGFLFDDAVQGPFLVPAAIRGAGGYLPSRAEMDTGFVAWGRGLRTRVRIPRMSQTRRRADGGPSARDRSRRGERPAADRRARSPARLRPARYAVLGGAECWPRIRSRSS